MKYLHILVFLFLYSFSLDAQDTASFQLFQKVSGIADTIPLKADIAPEFPGGDEARMRYLIENIKFPDDAKERMICGKVFLTFIINEDGTISDVTILRGLCRSINNESIRVIQNMPRWILGKQNGMPVKVRFNIPIKYSLDDKLDNTFSLNYNNGVDLMKSNKQEEAIRSFAFYEEGDKYYVESLYATGICYFQLQNYPEAIKSWEKAKSLGNKDCEPKLATAYFQVGNKFQKENKHNFAINSYSKALENAPADVNILYNRGISFYMTGEKEKSCSDWNKALELGSSDAEAVIEEYCN